ncbi:hypothetical protein T07_9717 [Trichinella nelsoni]|uniref:Uncharacterized protein n=1 Tax=Trichinella nelsoni TaxID=6336 RepID=A0A0V0SKA8_9BILA|nr:hypothetical protein T07_9717 [Trichinella nelsoni]
MPEKPIRHLQKEILNAKVGGNKEYALQLAMDPFGNPHVTVNPLQDGHLKMPPQNPSNASMNPQWSLDPTFGTTALQAFRIESNRIE